MKLNTVMAFAMIAMVACASAPPVATYQEAASVGSTGYMTAPADNGYYSVVYTGARGQTREQVAEYALLRAAEFTTESGHEWFAVISKKPQNVKLANKTDDLQSRTGGSFGGGATVGTGAGGAGGTTSVRGTSDSSVGGGPSTGGFGGGDVPYQVLERWDGLVPQIVIVIKMGSGSKASFDGFEKVPEIFSAKSIAADIRAKIAH